MPEDMSTIDFKFGELILGITIMLTRKRSMPRTKSGRKIIRKKQSSTTETITSDGEED